MLNIFRTLRLLSDAQQRVRSKDEGGEWALIHLPREHHPLVPEPQPQ